MQVQNCRYLTHSAAINGPTISYFMTGYCPGKQPISNGTTGDGKHVERSGSFVSAVILRESATTKTTTTTTIFDRHLCVSTIESYTRLACMRHEFMLFDPLTLSRRRAHSLLLLLLLRVPAVRSCHYSVCCCCCCLDPNMDICWIRNATKQSDECHEHAVLFAALPIQRDACA